jgi:hypothetical protein
MSTLEMNQPERVQAAFANLPPDYFADKDAFKFRFYVLDDIVHTGDDSFVPTTIPTRQILSISMRISQMLPFMYIHPGANLAAHTVTTTRHKWNRNRNYAD